MYFSIQQKQTHAHANTHTNPPARHAVQATNAGGFLHTQTKNAIIALDVLLLIGIIHNYKKY